MTPQYAHRLLAQRILNLYRKDKLSEDGCFGPKSIEAAQEWVIWTFPGKPETDRLIAAVIQKEASARGINAGAMDARWGPQTADAADRLRKLLDGDTSVPVRKDEHEDVVSDAKPGIKCWSPSTAAFMSRYGAVGENQGTVKSPYLLKLDWDLESTTSHFSAHESLVTRIEAAMADVLDHYGPEQIVALGLDRFGGCLNVRLKRGGSTPSVHSWGAAIDWYPSKNQLKQTKASALFAKAPYEAFIDIWEQHGFMSLGRCFDFDWMHVQANP